MKSQAGNACLQSQYRGVGGRAWGQWGDSGGSLKSAGSPDDSVSSGFSETFSNKLTKRNGWERLRNTTNIDLWLEHTPVHTGAHTHEHIHIHIHAPPIWKKYNRQIYNETYKILKISNVICGIYI